MQLIRSEGSGRMCMWFIALLFIFTGCKDIQIGHDPYMPRQGETIEFEVKVKNFNNAEYVKLWINGDETEITKAIQTVEFQTCKDIVSEYITKVDVKGEVKYNDGTVKEKKFSLDLTTGWNDKENSTADYSMYVAADNDAGFQTTILRMAWAFMDEFDTYPIKYYAWATPKRFKSSIHHNDMAVFIGHGNHHRIMWGAGGGDFLNMETLAFGNFAPCNLYGDLEYLVLFSSVTLSTADSDGHPFYWYWLNLNSNKMDRRPFMGLHQVIGLASIGRVIVYDDGSIDGDDFFDSFADFLDCGSYPRCAWFCSIVTELSLEDGFNRGAAIFFDEYENDNLWSQRDDHIYGNPNYAGHCYVEQIVVE